MALTHVADEGKALICRIADKGFSFISELFGEGANIA